MKFSIIIPTYQRPHTLPRAIASILTQTYPVWELILVNNDAAGVETPVDSRIRVLQHAVQPSASQARNWGLSHAEGDVVCFADDDDIMMPGALQLFALQFQIHPQAKLIHAGILEVSGEPNYSFTTPSCAVRRAFATPTWSPQNRTQDQLYWRGLILANGWSEEAGDIVMVRRIVAVALNDPSGGLRAGNL